MVSAFRRELDDVVGEVRCINLDLDISFIFQALKRPNGTHLRRPRFLGVSKFWGKGSYCGFGRALQALEAIQQNFNFQKARPILSCFPRHSAKPPLAVCHLPPCRYLPSNDLLVGVDQYPPLKFPQSPAHAACPNYFGHCIRKKPDIASGVSRPHSMILVLIFGPRTWLEKTILRSEALKIIRWYYRLA